MNWERLRDLQNRLHHKCDDEAVEAALQQIESDAKSRGFLTAYLMRGRNAINLFPRIEAYLRNDLSLESISILASFLHQDEVQPLLDALNIQDSELVDLISRGESPPIFLYPRERVKKILDQLREIIDSAECAKESASIVEFLLSRDRANRFARCAGVDSITMATDWCLRHPKNDLILPALCTLLEMKPTDALISIGEAQIYSTEWTSRTSVLLRALMAATKKGQKRAWIDDWFQRDHPEHMDDTVIAQWLRTSNCSRRALKVAKYAVRCGNGDNEIISTLLNDYSNRRTVNRWLKRYAESDSFSELDDVSRSLIYYSSYRQRKSYFMEQLLKRGGPELEIDLFGKRKDENTLDHTKGLVTEYPNAAETFKFVCAIASEEPDFAIPWLIDWVSGAMPHQTGVALCAIVESSATPKHLKMARDWLFEYKGRFPPQRVDRGIVINALLEVDPEPRIINAAKELLETGDNTRPYAKRMKRLLTRFDRYVAP